MSLSSLISVAKTSKTVLNNRIKSGYPCLVPVLRGNAFRFSPLRIMWTVDFLYIFIIFSEKNAAVWPKMLWLWLAGKKSNCFSRQLSSCHAFAFIWQKHCNLPKGSNFQLQFKLEFICLFQEVEEHTQSTLHLFMGKLVWGECSESTEYPVIRLPWLGEYVHMLSS